jgi:multicomponent Na+:H+ antiporter subunit D
MNSLALPLIIPLVAALACLFCSKSLKAQRGIALVSMLAQLTVSIYLLNKVDTQGIQVLKSGTWQSTIGIVLVADLFSTIMLSVTNLVSLCVLIYSFREVDEEIQKRYFFPLVNFLVMGVNGAFITGDIFNMYVWFEVMLLTSFILLCLGRKPDQLEGAVKYVILNLFSSLLFLIGIGVLYAKVGSLNIADISLKLAQDHQGYLVNSTAVLFLVAFGIKSAMFPFFFWLPASYHTPPTSISALFAGLLTKVGVYALVRVFSMVFVNTQETFQGIFYVLACSTMVIGVLCAAAQFEIRRILSVHIVSQIGYMILGLAIFTKAAIAGAIFYVIHNIFVKTNLFLISGVIQRQKKSTDLKKIGGLYRTNPYLAFIFVISAFSLAGIPPLSGFWAKYSVLKSAADVSAYFCLATGLAVGVVTLFSMTKIWAEAFWKGQPEIYKVEENRKGSKVMLAPILLLTVATILLGICGEPVFRICHEAAEQLLNPAEYIRAVLGSGYGA